MQQHKMTHVQWDICKIIKYYLEGKETEIQAGFRAGRSTIDHVFVIKQRIEKNYNNRQGVHFTLVVMEKHVTQYPYRNCGKPWKKTRGD